MIKDDKTQPEPVNPNPLGGHRPCFMSSSSTMTPWSRHGSSVPAQEKWLTSEKAWGLLFIYMFSFLENHWPMVCLQRKTSVKESSVCPTGVLEWENTEVCGCRRIHHPVPEQNRAYDSIKRELFHLIVKAVFCVFCCAVFQTQQIM